MANGFTAREQRFINEYMNCLNGADAARRAGYAENSARQTAHKLLTKADIKAEIQKRMEDVMSSQEVLYRIADIATGDLSQFFDVTGPVPILNFEKAEKAGQLHLLKKLTVAEGKITFELYDKQRALETFAKHHGLLADTLNVISWQDRAIQDIKDGIIQYEELEQEFDSDLATQLFRAAGIRISLPETTG